MSVTILVIDSSATDLLVFKNILIEYKVLTACDGPEAKQILNTHRDIDLVIVDLNSPNVDGFHIISSMQADEGYKDIPIIILTNSNELEAERKGMKLGAIDYIRKPIHTDSLKVRIDIHIELIRTKQLMEYKLYKQGLTYDAIFQQAPIGIAISYSKDHSVNNSLVSINPIFQQITGRTEEELINLGWIKITHPDDVEEDIRKFKELQSGEIKSYSMEKRYIRPDASIVWVDMVVASLTLSDEHMNNQICLVQDITERKRLERDLLESERSKSVLLSNLPGMAYRCNYDCHWTMQYVSAGCYQLTGYTSEDLIYNRRLSFNDLIIPDYREALWNEWVRILSERLPFRYEYEIVTAKGERRWVIEMGQGIYDEQGEVEALEGIILDISARKEIENSLRYNYEHDQWTGLYNRRYLEDLLANDAKLTTNIKRALVGINLSSIQRLSLTYGFHHSQEVIKRVAEALSLLCTDKHQLFNTYENRFVFYIKEYEDKDELVAFCKVVDKTLEAVFAADRIGSGIGIVEVDKDNRYNVEQLLKNLLNASERAIHLFNNNLGFCFFDKDMEVQIMREEDIKQELMRVVSEDSEGGLYLQYQPILDLKSNQICGFEALARLKSDELGFVSPLEFIPIAERTKLIIPIGQKIIIQAFGFLNKLKKSGYGDMSISINISAIQLLREDFYKELINIIAAMNVNPENVGLELTESLLADNYQEINRILGELKSAGIRMAIDDFGTGYSSLARERELNISCLKIDKSFIDKLTLLKEEEAITGDIISMAHKLGHCVVAEGVEHERQRLYLEKYECDKIQGYLISKPLDEDAALEMLKKQTTNNDDCRFNDSPC